MDKKFTCIIIDDEQPAIGLLVENIKTLCSNIQIIGTYTTWAEGLHALQTIKTDIVFLDVALNDKISFSLLKLLPSIESEIIFVTAHAEYAIEAFKYPTAGYIVKPVGDEELVLAVNKAIKTIEYKNTSRNLSQQKIHKIGIPNSNGIEYVNVDDILYFEAVDRYTKVVLKNSEILTSFSIGKFNYITYSHSFYHIHRSYIVNLNCILRYSISGYVTMINNKQVPISKNNKEEFLQLFSTVSSTKRGSI